MNIINNIKHWLRVKLGSDCENCEYYYECEEAYIPPPKKSKRIGKTYYVQAIRHPITHIIGDDTNDGLSQEKPLLTITEAVKRCKANDVVRVERE